MTAPPKNITKTLVIPPGSRERMILFPEGRDRTHTGSASLHLAGISDLTSGYAVYRPDCGHHFLGLVTRGKATFWLEEKAISLGPGEVCFLPAKTLHRYESGRPFSMIWYHLNSEHPHWRQIAGRQGFARPAQSIHQTGELLERAIFEAQSPVSATDSVPEGLYRLILAYLDRELGHDPSDAVQIMRQRLEKVWNAVCLDLARDWQVESLAKLAGLSVSHFHSAVMAAYRTAPMQIVRKFRIESAQALLLNTNHSLEEIAERTGYGSAFSFSRAFKATTKLSPRSYRKR